MNTRNKILALLSRSEKPLGPKRIASELKKSSVNIRKILSNLYKEGKIERVSYGEYALRVNVKNESVNILKVSVNVEDSEAKRLINKEMNKYRRAYYQRLKASDPEAYERIKKARSESLKKWRARNPERVKNWLKAYRKKYPERIREYQRRYWLKKALSGD